MKPLSGAKIRPDLSEEAPDHDEGAVEAKVTGCRRVASVYHPRMYEHRHVDADRSVIIETDGPASVAGEGLGVWFWSVNEKVNTVVNGMKVAFASKGSGTGLSGPKD